MSNKQLFKTENRVRYIMQEHPETRDNDMLLCAVYYEAHYGTSDLMSLYSIGAIPMESITRCRRKIQEAGELEASKDKQTIRKEQYKKYLNYARGINENE